jgi:large subunit ribosomal protein L15
MSMRLNDMKPGRGAKRPRLRVGRGASAGQGKTCGRGVKGQRARKGGYHKVGFEGTEVRLDELAQIKAEIIDLKALIDSGVVPVHTERAKVILSGEIKKAVTLKGVRATKGARAAIEAAGGKIEE